MDTVSCPRCRTAAISGTAMARPNCGAPLASQPRSAPGPATKPAAGLALLVPAWITVAAVVFGVLWFVVVGSEKPVVASQKVLIIKLADSAEDGWPVSTFDKALRDGGQVIVTFDSIRDAHPEIETFSPMNDGSYLTFGALANYVASHGWDFHGTELGGLMVFVR